MVMVTQAVGGAQRLYHDMPVLADFPCCDIPARAADSKYPPLQWQQRAAKVAVHRAAAHGSWLQVLFRFCTFIHQCSGDQQRAHRQNKPHAKALKVQGAVVMASVRS